MKYRIFTQRLRVAAVLFAATTWPTLHAGETLLVKWKEGPESHEATDGNAHIGSIVKRNFSTLGWQLVELPEGKGARQGAKEYQALGTVLAVEPDRRVELIPLPENPTVEQRDGHPVSDRPNNLRALAASDLTGVSPDDPMFRQQWNLKKIGITNAWAATTGDTNIVVAILDSGVDYTHPDLAANMWRNPGESGLDVLGHDKSTNGLDDDGNGYVDDLHGVDAVGGTGDPMDKGIFGGGTYHGTLCAGVIGAAGNNGKGIAGENWRVQIMAIRWLEPSPTNSAVVVSHWLAGWDYLLKMKRRGVNIRVTNNSVWGLDEGVALRDAVAAAGVEGILNVCIAGNDPIDQDIFTTSYPGAYDDPSVLSVAASNESDALTSFSGFGRSTVDLAAPGINLVSTIVGRSYQSGSWGTSFACPQVAGAAALLWAVKPEATRDEVRAALLGSVDQTVALQGRLVTQGRLNVGRAVALLTNANPPAIVIHASPAGQRTSAQAPIEVLFNRPMNRQSVESAFLTTPPIAGTFEWSADSRTFTFRPTELDRTANYSARILGSALDESGGTLDGNFDQAREGVPTDDYIWHFRFPTLNDYFADAQAIVGPSGSITGNSRYAFPEEHEPWHADIDNGASLWYRWTPTESGWFTFDLTTGTAYDTVLACYTGTEVASLIPIAGNDNYGTRNSSRLSFHAIAGTNYSLVVGSKWSLPADLSDLTKVGNFNLKWYPTPSPGFAGTQFSPSSGAPGSRITLTGTNFTGATAVLFKGTSASFTNVSGNNHDLRITAIVPPNATSGPLTVITPHGNVTSAALFEVLPLPVSLQIVKGEGAFELSWNETNDLFALEFSMDLAGWSAVSFPRRIEGGRTIQPFLFQPGNAYFRLKRNP